MSVESLHVSGTREELAPGEAHLWYAWAERCCTPARLAYYKSLLSAGELARLERFRFEYLKQEYLLTRALCRLTLSRYADVKPTAWRFGATEFGRPQITAPEPLRSLRFNLSNVPSLVACLVTRDIEAGVDVEETDRGEGVLDLVDHYFSEFELLALRALPRSLQRQRFFELWTLKESYIKARGMGLSIPLEEFSFELDASPIRIHFSPRLVDAAKDWQFQLFAPSERHQMAVSLRRCVDNDWLIRVHETIPGSEIVLVP